MNDQSKSNITLKYLVVGDSGVGKTSLLMRYCEDSFQTDYLSTIGVDFKIKRIEHNGRPITLNIWDTAGQESFNELHPTYYYGAHVCILVFDANRKITYKNLQNWYKEMRDNCPHIPVMVIANKIDLDEKATGRRYKFIEDIGCEFNFVSAADGTNVVSVFQKALEMGLHYKQNPHEDDFMSEVRDLLGNDSI